MTMKKVAIVGVGQTKQEASKPHQSFAEMLYEAVKAALNDANMWFDDIGNVVSASSDFWDGRTISNMAIQDVTGTTYKKTESKVASDGTYATVYGMMRTLSEYYDTTLVAAHCKGSEGNTRIITNAIFDPLYQRAIGLDAISGAALQARRYMTKYGITEEQMAKVSVKNHGNARNNPYAQLPMDLKIDDVLNSRMISDPLKLYDCSPISDGAAAVILASEDKAKEITDNPVWIRGAGYSIDAFYLTDRDLAECDSLRAAASMAYRMAGITDPGRQIDVAEVYDSFSYQELMWTEGLGFCKPGEGGKLIDSGRTQMDGDLPVNPSGGVISAHTVTTAGLVRVVEAALQVRGEADKRQVPDVNTAVAHGTSGYCGQGNCVIVLGREK